MTDMKVIKRDGQVVIFDEDRIGNAIGRAVKAVGSGVTEDVKDALVQGIVNEIQERFVDLYPNVENIQDVVEKHLVKEGLYEIAKSYILYRSKRQKEREEKKKQVIEKAKLGRLTVKKKDGRTVLFDMNRVRRTITRSCKGYEQDITPGLIIQELIKNIYDGVTTEEIEKALVLATVPFIERDPSYNIVAAKMFMQRLYKEVFGRSISEDILEIAYRDSFISGIKKSVDGGVMDERMLLYDLKKLSEKLIISRDDSFGFLGIQTLYERYFVKAGKKIVELPQSFWMRVAMGLALKEKNKDARAMEFYETLSSMRFVSSTPTLFHSGLSHPQLSSCYLTTIEDDLTHIFKCLGDHAQLSKWSGGLGNDWTNIRATGALIKSTNVESQGVIPFFEDCQ